MIIALLLLCSLSLVVPELVTRPTPHVPSTIADAMTVSQGTYSAHFKKLPGEYRISKNNYNLNRSVQGDIFRPGRCFNTHIFDWLLTNQSIKSSVHMSYYKYFSRI